MTSKRRRRGRKGDHEDDDSTQVVGGSNRVRSGQHTGKSKSSSRSWMKLLDEDDGQASSVREVTTRPRTRIQQSRCKRSAAGRAQRRKRVRPTFRHRSAMATLTERSSTGIRAQYLGRINRSQTPPS